MNSVLAIRKQIKEDMCLFVRDVERRTVDFNENRTVDIFYPPMSCEYSGIGAARLMLGHRQPKDKIICNEHHKYDNRKYKIVVPYFGAYLSFEFSYSILNYSCTKHIKIYVSVLYGENRWRTTHL
jgi:hypothetical protein